MNARQNTKGFTIIEVVLVLAIAALIFLMIFVALPALQASQRDTARKNDASIVASGVVKFIAAYKQIPHTDGRHDAELRKRIPKLDQYQNNAASILVARPLTRNPTASQVLVYPWRKCNGPNLSNGGAKNVAVRVLLEDSTIYCVDAS